METGTGKTYVYIKTIFELNKKYGWSKFIVVVPSIAIREGVKKSFEITTNHFMEHYGKKARFFVYDSSNLHQLDSFASSSDISVMIINTQSFASSFNENNKSRNNTTRIIYSKRDEFASRKPIDVIAATRPIIILDEPQKMGGKATQKALKKFNPLFCLNYSATHAKKHNLVYVLDALDAFNKKLVKKIEVKGIELKNLRGTNKYLYLEEIILSKKEGPKARIELEIKYNKSINREIRIVKVGDDLYHTSNEMEQYKEGFVVSDINPLDGTITFSSGDYLHIGEASGDLSEKEMRRIQIRETILSHFEKEEALFNKGIKTLSLFFIDEVAKYRQYDEDGNELLGEYGQIFEEEYKRILNDNIKLFNSPYQRYLRNMCSDVSKVHKGYFSIDKKGRSIDSTIKRGSDFSDDISAYDLILKKKERLLSFEEPTRFIFSHSALREGWDNPNVFQICTLKHSDSQTAKRQEVGRGLRLCVNQNGNRMDAESCGDSVHDINMLTVVASESYKDFVTDLQSDMKEDLYDRPTTATKEYFKGKYVKVDGEPTPIDSKMAASIEKYLETNGYIDSKKKVTDKYRSDVKSNSVAPLPETLEPMSEGIHTLIQSVYDDKVLDSIFIDGHKTKIKENPLNENFYKKEFQDLWNQINRKYAYTVDFDSNELINNSISYINEKLFVSELKYTTTIGRQKSKIDVNELDRGESFKKSSTSTSVLNQVESSQIKYDLIGKVAQGAVITRKTVAAILKGISPHKLLMFRNNPEEFISKIVKLIKDQKATLTVEHISYNEIEGEYDSSIFTAGKISQSFDKAFKSNKAIQDYIFTDDLSEDSVEKRFATDLEEAKEVSVYAKLPKDFCIPTPVGDYSPDWAIAFYEGTVKHIYFIAETKGSMDSLQLRPVESAKIACAKKLFNEISTNDVKYHEVDSYKTLLDIMDSL